MLKFFTTITSLFALLSLVFVPQTIEAQIYQLPNPGFEQWDAGGESAEPSHWNSFATSDGSLAGFASAPHHFRRNGGRPQSDGSHFLTIYSTSILGIVANGNMTTGRIHAGSMQAGGAENYNYTQRADADFSQPFTATPDSMYFWVSYYSESSESMASISAFLHGDNDFRDPTDKTDQSKYAANAIAYFSRTTPSKYTYSWTQVRVPFVYDGTAAPAYILMSLATNKDAGAGAAYDSLSIDDIQFVYSSWLTSITVNGTSIADFAKDKFSYEIVFQTPEELRQAQIGFEKEVADASVYVDTMSTDSQVSYSLVVVAEDGVTTHTYTVSLTCDPVGVALVDKAQFCVYPNPTTDRVSIQSQGASHIVLRDLSGKVVLNRNFATPTTWCQLDISSLPQGVYLLSVDGTTRTFVKK